MVILLFMKGKNMKVAVASVLRAAEQIACLVAKYIVIFMVNG